MRVFIGFKEIAQVATNYAKGFGALGHETYTVVAHRNPFYPDALYDVVISERVPLLPPGTGILRRGLARIRRERLRFSFFLRALRSCDIFIFFYHSFLPRFWDYPALKGCGKHIVAVFLGSEIRYSCAFEQEMCLLGMADEVRPFIDRIKNLPGEPYSLKLSRVRAAERYADLILSQPGYGQLQKRPYMRFNIPLDLSQLRFHVPDRQVPVVIHAPSSAATKGTPYVLAAVEQLKQEGVPFEFQLIEKMPNAELRERLAEADIVVDELFADTLGVLSSEAMATGNAVLVRYPAEYARVPPGCPAVNVTKDTLVGRLREVILNRELRRQLAHAGRPYVEANNDHVRIAQQILDWLQPGGILEYDFVPTFYKQFVMLPELFERKHPKMRLWHRLWSTTKHTRKDTHVTHP